ncbi:MAG: hypothetical protein US86_C0004G0019 [Candidatus Daviesbacteria bacterium GW2011_GWA2_38_24]|uniref:Uncharacterized protein n=1 Tax=Candidatus Daviesbacteria bacterium GW2011_GWA2_38_24 TaxID=1618422 RepID=A0A0G0MP88_9BACT|nr:MAG: hypothetical protein US86_C0004G0019 [Candidatus Daviesbacteria bacterium GW2011_GWA2_38_24]OGE23465.1 MAG: hypothetical protein A2688_00090 [Candidatus Daviesbacteria bacterium RIFCSPHIGHO2_01_FULL_38_8]
MSTKKDRVLCEYLRADWLRLVDILPDLSICILAQICPKIKGQNGQIDDARVYNYALTASQVKLLMNEGAVRFGPSTGSP